MGYSVSRDQQTLVHRRTCRPAATTPKPCAVQSFWQKQSRSRTFRVPIFTMLYYYIRIIQNETLTAKLTLFSFEYSGNDAAAGHGNFFDEQYTIVMQNRARDLFRSVGLDLVARPYGMGGATSAPEIAGCLEMIYGSDVDLITWDFSMTDGRFFWRMEFFAHRVMMLKNHPPLLVLNAGTEPVRKQMVEHLTEQGMAALRQDDHYVISKQLEFPDSKGASDEELELMPEYVRYFRCAYGIENGGDCIHHKFTQNGTCDDRPYRTNWHKGWYVYLGQTNVNALIMSYPIIL